MPPIMARGELIIMLMLIICIMASGVGRSSSCPCAK